MSTQDFILILQALKDGEDGLALRLLDEGADLFRPDVFGISPLAWLLDQFRHHELDVWRSPFLPRLADPAVRDKNGRHALHYAIVAGDLEVARKLCHLGTPPDLETTDGISPRELALSMGRKELTDYLTPHNRRPARKLPRPSLALREACATADSTAIKACLEAGANPDGDEWDIPLYWADFHRSTLFYVTRALAPDEEAAEAAQWLLISGANPNRVYEYEWLTPLTEAAARGNLPLSKVLLDWGALPNEIDIQGRTSLDAAMRGRDSELIDLIRSHGGKTATELTNES